MAEVGQVYTFDYTGAKRVWKPDANVSKIKIECWGAAGGSPGSYQSAQPGKGGYSVGVLKVSADDELYIYVGGTTSNNKGGFNGGGNGYYDTTKGLGGGGASDVRKNTDSLEHRIIVAGGGGGIGYDYKGGDGGGDIGESGNDGGGSYAPTGGTQTIGGAWHNGAGVAGFGYGGNSSGGATGGGGGGGWYGGGSIFKFPWNTSAARASGAGGSGYIGGVMLASMLQGVQSGNGLVKITVLPSDDYLILDGEEIKTYSNDTWITIGTTPVTQALFEQGFKDLSVFRTGTSFTSLNPELLCLTNEENPTRHVTQTIDDWMTVSNTLPIKAMFEEEGILDFKKIPDESLELLKGEIQVVTYTNVLNTKVQTKAVPKAQRIVMNQQLAFNQIKSISVNAATAGDGITEVHLSPDNGTTWHRYTPAALAALTEANFKTILPTGDVLIGFYLDINEVKDVASIVSITINSQEFIVAASIRDVALSGRLTITKKPTAFLSLDAGANWKEIAYDDLVSVSDLPSADEMVLKLVLEDGQEVYALSYSWV